MIRQSHPHTYPHELTTETEVFRRFHSGPTAAGHGKTFDPFGKVVQYRSVRGAAHQGGARLAILRPLVRPRLSGVRLAKVNSPARPPGLGAFSNNPAVAAWWRCRTHYQTNPMALAP